MNKVKRNLWIMRTRLLHLKKVGRRSCIIKPLQIDNHSSISIGNSVYIAEYAWLMGSKILSDKGLVVNDNTVIGHFAHIIAYKEVVIEESVLIADKVFISDCTHNYLDINTPIINQDVSFIKPVIIGEGSWLGENVCVCGASIGKHCVIGANSVVTKDIPDYCVAVGSPAKVVKKYDTEMKVWVKDERKFDDKVFKL